MCLICIEIEKNKMTSGEGRRALGEMRAELDPAHLEEVEAKLVEAEQRAASSVVEQTP